MACITEDRDLYERLKKSVVIVFVKQDKAISLGTGFVVRSEGLILTCHHMLSKSRNVICCRDVDGAEYNSTVVKENPARDMLLLKVTSDEPMKWNTAEFSTEDDFPVGKNVFTIGHSNALTYCFLKGQLAYPHRHGFCRRMSTYFTVVAMDSDLPVMEINNVHTGKGHSGKPVFDSAGRVIGMLMGGGESANFVIPKSELESFIAG